MMNNKDFVSDLAGHAGLGVREASSLVAAAVSAIAGELVEENAVAIDDFGTFEVKKKLERVLVNPATRQRMLVPPKLMVSFKPNASLKLRIKD